MGSNIKLIKLDKKKTLNSNSTYLYIFQKIKNIKFVVKRIYFHDYKKKHRITNKINNSDSIFIPISGVLNFSISKKKIILKKKNALLIKKNVKFDLVSIKSYFIVLANKDYQSK